MVSADGEGSALASQPLTPFGHEPDTLCASRLALYSASEDMEERAGEENPRPARVEEREAVACADMLAYSRGVRSVDSTEETVRFGLRFMHFRIGVQKARLWRDSAERLSAFRVASRASGRGH